MIDQVFGGICGRVAPGLCRLSMSGDIAIKTRAGYRTCDAKARRLTNCDSFVLDVGEDFFFVLPTNRVKPGDIILAGGMPKCVIEADEQTITAISYEDASVQTLIPERHVFMGSAYLYGRIVSLFGRNGAKGKKGMNGIMKYMMLQSLLKQKDGSLGGLLPLMLMGGHSDFMANLFDGDDGEDEEAKGA